MSTKQIECEIFLVMNEDGDWEVGKYDDSGDVANTLVENAGGECMRSVKLTVRMTPPQLAIAAVTVPDDVGNTVDVQAA